MATLNQMNFIGNLTREPEFRHLPSGKKIAKFAVAMNRKTKTGVETLYLNAVAWDGLADVAIQYLHKGMSVYGTGRLSIRKYDDKDGNKRDAVEVILSSFLMLDKKRRAAEAVGDAEPANVPSDEPDGDDDWF